MRRIKEEHERYKVVRLTFRPDIYDRIMRIPRGYRSLVVNRVLCRGLDLVLLEMIKEEEEKLQEDRIKQISVIGSFQEALKEDEKDG